MRSLQYVIISVIALILFSTVLYFGIKDYKSLHKEEHKEKPKIPVSPESQQFFQNKEGITKIEVPKPESGYPELANKEIPKHEEAVHTSGIKYTEKEGEITTSAGSILLKSVLKEMTCVMGELSPYSVSCCGTLPISEDNTDDIHGCLLLDTYQVSGSEEPSYRMRFIIGKDLIMYREVTGFPKPDSKCYPLVNQQDKQICASINFVSLDNDFTDTTGYKTCTFMNFGFGTEQNGMEKKGKVSESKEKGEDKTEKPVHDYYGDRHNDDPQLLGYAENVKCDVDKELIIKKSLNTSFSVVIRLKLDSVKKDNVKETVKSDVKETAKDSDTKLAPKNDEKEVPEVHILPILEVIQQPDHENLHDSSSSSNEVNHDNLDLSASPVGEPVHSMGVNEFFKSILNFITDHILSMFISRKPVDG